MTLSPDLELARQLIQLPALRKAESRLVPRRVRRVRQRAGADPSTGTVSPLPSTPPPVPKTQYPRVAPLPGTAAVDARATMRTIATHQ